MQHFLKTDNGQFGAVPDEQGPLGGGEGYAKHFSPNDGLVVDTVESLISAIASAKSGDVIFIPGDTVMELSPFIYIEKLILKIPGGVTLAGDRGQNGSPGALLVSDALDTPALLEADGPGVRLSGLRLQGPNPKRHLEHHRRALRERKDHDYYYQFPLSRGIRTAYSGLEVDNCELSGFSHSAVALNDGEGHRIHHNTIHHNQYQGLGYGVVHNTAFSEIEYNLFNWNRHSIAGTGRTPSGYTARHNVELGESLSHCFDMHGGRDRKDDTNTAGTRIRIENNTFHAPQTPVVVRGVPEKEVRVTRNWFPHHQSPEEAVRAEERTVVEENAYGESSSVKIA